MEELFNLQLDPVKFYALIKIMRSVSGDSIEYGHLYSHLEKLQDIIEPLATKVDKLNNQRLALATANQNMYQEIRIATKTNPFLPIEEQDSGLDKFKHTLDGVNFLRITYEMINGLHNANYILYNICQDLIPEPVLVGSDNIDLSKLNFEKIQQITFESQLNRHSIERFVGGCIRLTEAKLGLIDLADKTTQTLNLYYLQLNKRHSEDGVKVFRDPIATDVAISILENIDAHGEIESGKKPDEVSAYSIRKAEVILNAIRNPNIFELVKKPEGLIDYISLELKALWKNICDIYSLFNKTINEVIRVINRKKQPVSIQDTIFYTSLQNIKDINPHTIVGKESTRLLTSEEQYNINFKNDTLEKIVELLITTNAKAPEIIKYVLERKATLRKFFQEENSFYICRIGAGNSFLGEAPGALVVVPGSKPNAKLDDIMGSGYDELRTHVESIEAAAEWHDLFVATSPSKSGDKSNVLLVGPMGCGKTQALRAVAADSKSLGIFAQGSDFLTCWKGEDQKNPKRLFEGAIKLQRESNKHVHILIDEIDSVLKKKELLNYGDTDLTLEFQTLMDGVIAYPHITVWGTTNFPERITMAMIRRFSKILIVGELDLPTRVKMLKYYANYMPVADSFKEDAWTHYGERLDGAVGDVVRKVVDHVWRSKMSVFVRTNPKEAAKLKDYLIEQNEGKRFDIAKFDDKLRQSFKNRLRPFVSITMPDLAASVDMHLKNVGVYNEILTAKKTYAEAKKFVSALENQ